MKFPFTTLIALLAFAVRAAELSPHFPGLAHIALQAHDVEKSRAFYTDFLGFAAPCAITNKDGSIRQVSIKINDRQTVELFPEKEAGTDRLRNIAFETDDASKAHQVFSAHGVKTSGDPVTNQIGDVSFTVADPDGHTLEIVQYTPAGGIRLDQGKFLPDTRISKHMMHVGILVGNLDSALEFYAHLLGGAEIWRGARDPKQLNWVNVKLADSDDYVEFMLYSEMPNLDKLGSLHHMCLTVPDVEAAKATLEARATRVGYTRPMAISTGINRKRQLNVWDPDGTRVELMEPNTVDGKPAKFSTAPPPKHAP